MDNIEKLIDKFEVSDSNIINHILQKTYILEANMATLMNGQARILAHLEKREPEEILKEINDRNTAYLAQVQDDYVTWLANFLRKS